jgi:hypothetical protein
MNTAPTDPLMELGGQVADVGGRHHSGDQQQQTDAAEHKCAPDAQ